MKKDISVLGTQIESKIYLIRNQKVMLDQDLAVLYEVETRALVQAIKRNKGRFPEDFMFVLSDQEFSDLRSQIVTTSWGGRRTAPYAFTEHGVTMLSSVLRSPKAVDVNIEIVRAFVRLRTTLANHAELSEKLNRLEQKYDHQFKTVFDAIRAIMNPKVPPPKRTIGFRADDNKR